MGKKNTYILLCYSVLFLIIFGCSTNTYREVAYDDQSNQKILCDYDGDGYSEQISLMYKGKQTYLLISSKHGVIERFDNIKTRVLISRTHKKKYKGKITKDDKVINTSLCLKNCSIILNFFEESEILYYWDGERFRQLWLAD